MAGADDPDLAAMLVRQNVRAAHPPSGALLPRARSHLHRRTAERNGATMAQGGGGGSAEIVVREVMLAQPLYSIQSQSSMSPFQSRSQWFVFGAAQG